MYENLLPTRIQYKYSSVELEKVCVFSTLQTNLSYFDNCCSHETFYFTLKSALLVCIIFIYYYPKKLFSCKSGWVQIFRVLWATKCYLGSGCSYSILTLFLKFASPCYPIFQSLRIFENNISLLSESECADLCLVHPNNKYHFKFLLIIFYFSPNFPAEIQYADLQHLRSQTKYLFTGTYFLIYRFYVKACWLRKFRKFNASESQQ